MLERFRGLLRRRGPVGALVLAATVAVVTGTIALNAVLAGWTYRNASRRDLREPGRWALSVLLAGPLAFVPYVALQWYRDRSSASDRDVARERRDAVETRVRDAEPTEPAAGRVGSDADPDGSKAGPAGTTDERDTGARRAGSLASASLRYGGKAAALGARGARWAGRRALARMNNG